jgi:hypothetical protein
MIEGATNLMEDGSFEEAVVVRYLLGDLPEEAQIQVEDRAFTDPAYLGVIEAVEADLIDAYVRGEMPASEQREFEARFLVSAQRRKKVEFARALARVAKESKPAPASLEAKRSSVAPHSWWEMFAQVLRGRNPAFQFATAAVVLILAGAVSWQAVQTARLHGQMSQLEVERRLQQEREQVLQTALNQERARSEDLAAQMLKNPGRPSVASLMLFPGMMRSQGTLPELVVPASAQLARIRIQLEPRDNYQRFRVELRTRAGEEILARGNLREQRSGTGRIVLLDAPASIFDSGDYELTLIGMTGGQMIQIGYYSLVVKKK